MFIMYTDIITARKKGYTVPKSTSIGKCADDDAEMMYPNTNFLKFFPAEELPETRGEAYRSGCLRVGTYLVLRRIVSEYHLDEMLGDIIGKDSGLFLDLAAYSIITENNAGQYYPDYAFNHPLFTDGMPLLIRSDFIKGRNFRFTMTLEMIGCSPLQYQKSVKQKRVLRHA